MPKAIRTRVFMSGRSQHVTIPAEFRFSTDSVYVHRSHGGELILSPAPPDWDAIFAALDKAGFEGFLEDRDQGEYEKREPL